MLDEITNHLDIMTIESLTQALHPKTGFKGGVILVSHDERFINNVATELWECRNGTLNRLQNAGSVIGDETCGVKEYKERILSEFSKPHA